MPPPETRAARTSGIDQKTDLPLGFYRRFHNAFATGHVDGYGLGQINVLPCLDGVASIFGVEVRRSLDYDSVDLRRDTSWYAFGP